MGTGLEIHFELSVWPAHNGQKKKKSIGRFGSLERRFIRRWTSALFSSLQSSDSLVGSDLAVSDATKSPLSFNQSTIASTIFPTLHSAAIKSGKIVVFWARPPINFSSLSTWPSIRPYVNTPARNHQLKSNHLHRSRNTRTAESIALVGLRPELHGGRKEAESSLRQSTRPVSWRTNI